MAGKGLAVRRRNGTICHLRAVAWTCRRTHVPLHGLSFVGVLANLPPCSYTSCLSSRTRSAPRHRFPLPWHNAAQSFGTFPYEWIAFTHFYPVGSMPLQCKSRFEISKVYSIQLVPMHSLPQRYPPSSSNSYKKCRYRQKLLT
jgi:hypothetical protein